MKFIYLHAITAYLSSTLCLSYGQSLRGDNRDASPLYDCTECSDELAVVCANGLTYQNACLAQCQGELGIVRGACMDGENISRINFINGDESNSKGIRATKMVALEEMKRFSQEGFNYIGSVETIRVPSDEGDAQPREGYYLKEETNFAEDHTKDEHVNEMASAIRVTSIGGMYVARNFKLDPLNAPTKEEGKAKAETACSKGETSPPPPMNPEEKSVLGQDTRKRVSYGESWPYWRIGQTSTSSYKYWCSGSIVGYNKVLTNAHCVFSRSSNSWNFNTKFNPGRNPGDPWGSWNTDYITISTAYINNNDWWNYDYAIMTMRDDNWTGKHIGQYMGYFPIRAAPCTIDEPNSRIVGYPSDKASGTMWTSGRCDDWSYSCGSKYIRHQCDTFPGSSGSAMLDQGVVFGVHANGAGNGSWNGGPAFTDAVAAMLNDW